MAEQWHKQDVWTPEVEEIFNTKIKRARYHQGSYFANQVRALFSAGDLENAEILARRGLVETKELEPPRAVVLNRMITSRTTSRRRVPPMPSLPRRPRA